MRDNTTNRTLLPRLSAGAFASLGSGLLALVCVALVSYGAWLIFHPAGFIVAGLGCVALQYQFFGGR
jgi:hypothetical protein